MDHTVKNNNREIMEKSLGATAVPPDSEPPPWIKMLLDHQTWQLQQLMAPILQHVTAEQKSTTRAVPSSFGQNDGTVPLQSSSQDTPDHHSARTDAPFAAELEVIRQRSQGLGPVNIPSLHDPAVTHREERVPQRSAPTHMTPHDMYGTTGNSGNRQDMMRQWSNEDFEVKLVTYDGQEDWDSFLLPFERQAHKYGWTGAERVDRLHECLCGVAVRYVCSLPEHIREDYTLLKEHLTQRFGVKDPPTTVRRRLGELRQGKESSAEFAEEVRRLVSLAYPGTDLKLQDQLATDTFLKGLKNQKVAYEVMNCDPHSLAEAQKQAEAHKHNFRATLGRETEMQTGRARRISWADEDTTPYELFPVTRRIQSPKYVTEEQFKRLTDQVEQLHFKMDQLQPLIMDYGRVGSMGHSTAYGEKTHQQDRGRRPTQQLPSQSLRVRSPGPSQTSRMACFLCGEMGHFGRDCSRSPSPTCPNNLQSEPYGFRGPPTTEDQALPLQLGPLTRRVETTCPDNPLIMCDPESDQLGSTLEAESSGNAQPMVRRVTGNSLELPEHLQALYTSSSEALNEERQAALVEHLFAASDPDLGHLSVVTHKIDTGTARPEHQPVHQMPPRFQGEEEQHLQEMLNAGEVVPSSSEGSEVHPPQDLWLGVAKLKNGREPIDHVQKLVNEMAQQHLRAAQQRQKRLHDLQAQKRMVKLGKKDFGQSLQSPWKGPYIASQLWASAISDTDSASTESDVIPAWIKRQRHKDLPQFQDPVTSIAQCPDVPQPLSIDHSTENEMDEAGLDPPGPATTEGKRRVAARRRRQAALHLRQEEIPTLEAGNVSQEPPERRTQKGRIIHPPACYPNS